MRNPDPRSGQAATAGPPSSSRPPLVTRFARRAALVAAGAPLLLVSGCNMALLAPKGDIGVQEKNLILISLGLMLLVVIPVIALTLWFAWRYRASSTNATYAPRWSHSTAIEVVVWTIPCVIVLTLAVLIWRTTHSLDPYRPIESQTKPVRVDVVALNWKWLFIYPDYGVASVNQLAIPVDTPVEFNLTAESLMNSFFIPQLGSQVYAMPAMQTKLHLIANEPGIYAGRSAAFSGPGFSDMHFETLATSRAEFDAWIAQAKASPAMLSRAAYERLALPGEKTPVTLYSNVAPGLFDGVVGKYMRDVHGNPICGTVPSAVPSAVPGTGAPALTLNRSAILAAE
ncbi:cytochrome bo3 quinol oxidase subunit 2 [Paraburkholderia silvatlantica]|uniref:Ubiquinol oxidase subunit 2 n=1 Tax=Paraburkholderia silvatlantica TaxID=321895 RepID=A0A2V4U2U2_9BURK|nr:ubiquinol oxidase subunit II [Paraburkholderia silvatlantica]PYE28058.1 cytochrome bo3 quinol oxidase subunit 2 [Paraburkholderia silvatlantica]